MKNLMLIVSYHRTMVQVWWIWRFGSCKYKNVNYSLNGERNFFLCVCVCVCACVCVCVYSDEEAECSDEEPDPFPPDHPLLPFMARFFQMSSPDLGPIPPPPPPPLPPRRNASSSQGPEAVPPECPPLPPRGVPRNIWIPQNLETKKRTGFYLKLSMTILKCLSVGFVQSSHTGVHRLLCDKLQPEHISALSYLIQNTDSKTLADSGRQVLLEADQFGSFAADLSEMVHKMIMEDVIGRERLQGVLLHELGLSTRCWPLQVSPTVLSLLARVLVCRLQYQSVQAPESECDDSLILLIWKGYACTRTRIHVPVLYHHVFSLQKRFINALEENASSDEEPDEGVCVCVCVCACVRACVYIMCTLCTCVFVCTCMYIQPQFFKFKHAHGLIFFSFFFPDLEVAHMQTMLFVWHSFTVESRSSLLLQVAKAIIHTAQVNERYV